MRVGGVPEPKPATLVDAETPITLADDAPGYVSRGGHKLAGAMERFPIEVKGRRALDAGASTGGFTDYLLREGASRVTAVDVGYGQLDWKLREDPRVEVRERVNLRLAHPADLGAPFDLVVADLSFISLSAVAGVLAGLGDAGTDYVLLVKPQFEVGPERVGRGGIVRDPDARREALLGVARALEEVGIGARDVAVSPLEGAKGNVEYFVWGRLGPRALSDDRLAEAVTS